MSDDDEREGWLDTHKESGGAGLLRGGVNDIDPLFNVSRNIE